MSDLPNPDCVGAVLGTPYGLLEVTGYSGMDEDGQHLWRVACLNPGCGWSTHRKHWRVLNHRVRDERPPTNWCGPCKYEHDNPGKRALRTKTKKHN